MTECNKLSICDECKSELYADSQSLKSLCPNCAHHLYRYANCKHEFENDKCVKRYWNRNTSKYNTKKT